jgi:hypothetical protein
VKKICLLISESNFLCHCHGKSQGLAIKGLLAYFLGNEEKVHGLTYVAFSRILAIEQMFVG